MSKKISDLSPSMQIAAKTVYATFKILKDAGGHLPGREVIDQIRKTVEFNDWEKHQYEKTGYIRWESILHFYTVGCIKAGFLRKKSGVWYLTDEGEKAIKLGDVGLHEKSISEYKRWDEKRKKDLIPEDDTGIDDTDQIQKAKLDQLESEAKSGLKNFISNMNAYEFQDLIAALLRAMGYFTPFVAPKGPDGGVDIVAFQDPLGTKTPRIKVQVKHRPESSVSTGEVQGLLGSMNKDGDVGLFVTSGTFSSQAERFARSSQTHVKLIDFDTFTDLWQQFYNKLTDEDKNLLPLYPIYFLGSNE